MLTPFLPIFTSERVRRQGQVAATGTVKNFVLMIRFSDHKQGSPYYRALPPVADMTKLFNSVGGDPRIAPTGSVRGVF